MNEIAKVVASMLVGKSAEEVESVLDGLISQAEEERQETMARQQEQAREASAMSLEELEDEISKAPMGSKARRELVAAHREKLNQAAPPSQEQSQIEQREDRRAQLLSELSALRRGYQSSPEKSRRIMEINAELGELSGATQAPGRIDITKYIVR
jgi:hypothetical protein